MQTLYWATGKTHTYTEIFKNAYSDETPVYLKEEQIIQQMI